MARMRSAEGILRTLWSNSVGMADKLLPNPEITALLADVRRDFFENGLALLHWAVDEHGAKNSLSASDLAAEFVPYLQSSEQLRTAIVTQSIRTLERDAAKALGSLVNSAALTLGILAVLVVVAVFFSRALFSPLMRLHSDVLALANGNNDTPRPVPAMAQEVDDIFAGLAILRDHIGAKRALEEEQRRLNRRLRRLAETDTLTGLLNRRALLTRIDAVFRRADRIGETLAVALFDIDHFKLVNDTHGHAVGDEVLAGVARLVESTLQSGDFLARIGGEEFVIILRHMDETTAFGRLERIRLLLAETPVQTATGLSVTASFGMAMRPAGSEIDWDGIFSLADQRLYLAKNNGRNRVVVDGISPETRRRA
ncbi:hypothetical protein VW35_05780 [Devosia soli]|uniref:diguanylate cyclase n=2 Tax=Devosia soli TaxID=361041 RepID=A0A0F5LC91_9HYPH|nr:hypothetical protein VW35_05780 [Devosia soli]